jgi:hypothetical protein
MGLHLPKSAYLSAAVILAGIVLPQGYLRWLNTRTFVALEMPLVLSRGQVRTADFSVNLKQWYHISLWVDSDFSGCQSGLSHLALRSRSIVYRNGHAIESSEGVDRYLGHFYADTKGRYKVSIEIISDPSCLNEGHPRIGVWTDSSRSLYLYNELREIGLIVTIAGLGLFAFLIFQIRARAATTEGFSISQGTRHGWYHLRKLAPKTLFPLLPPYGLVLSSVLVPTFLIFIYAWGWDRPSVGIRISVAEERSLPGRTLSSIPHPVVRLEQPSRRLPATLYLNSKVIGWDELGNALTNQLKLRPDWVVYVEADDQVSWSDVIAAMDIIRSRRARIVLVTQTKVSRPSRHN